MRPFWMDETEKGSPFRRTKHGSNRFRSLKTSNISHRLEAFEEPGRTSWNCLRIDRSRRTRQPILTGRCQIRVMPLSPCPVSSNQIPQLPSAAKMHVPGELQRMGWGGCPICGDETSAPFLQKGELNLVQCGQMTPSETWPRGKPDHRASESIELNLTVVTGVVTFRV